MGSSGWSVCWWRGGDCRAQTLGGTAAPALGEPGTCCWGPGLQVQGTAGVTSARAAPGERLV